MQVLEVWRYPIKSIGGERLDRVDVTELGIGGDRGWGLVDNHTGLVLTARREPRLLMATCTLRDGAPITATADGAELRESADYTAWLDRPVTLTRAGDDGGTYENPLDAEHDTDWVSWTGPGGAWHDSGRARVSLVSSTSLGGWDARRFRPNIVLDGAGEDDLVGASVTLGSAVLDVVKPIQRCVMVTRPQPGLDRDLDVLRRINRDRGAALSVGAIVRTPGSVGVGDHLTVAP